MIKYRNQSLQVETIPKGTLLFRISKDPVSDIRGIPVEDGKRCIAPFFNVYFYPDPFIADITLDKWEDIEDIPYHHVFVTTHPIKVLRLINPSPYTRLQMNKKRSFLRPCNRTRKGCLPRTDHKYNPCFSETLASKYPDVVGTLAIARGDAVRFKRSNSTRKQSIRTARDAEGYQAPPELQLYPLRERSMENIVSDESEPLPTSYKLLKTFDRKDIAGITEFMSTRTKFNPKTFFYTLRPTTSSV